MLSISRYQRISYIQNFSLFQFCVTSKLLAYITNAPFTSMLKILSDPNPIINQTIGSNVQINRSLQLCFKIFVFYQFSTTKSVQNNQNVKFSQTLHTKSGNSTLSKREEAVAMRLSVASSHRLPKVGQHYILG